MPGGTIISLWLSWWLHFGNIQLYSGIILIIYYFLTSNLLVWILLDYMIMKVAYRRVFVPARFRDHIIFQQAYGFDKETQ